MIATLTRKMAEDPMLFNKLLPGLQALSFIPLLLIIQFDLGAALAFPLALVSILSSALLIYLGATSVGINRNQNRVS